MATIKHIIFDGLSCDSDYNGIYYEGSYNVNKSVIPNWNSAGFPRPQTVWDNATNTSNTTEEQSKKILLDFVMEKYGITKDNLSSIENIKLKIKEINRDININKILKKDI